MKQWKGVSLSVVKVERGNLHMFDLIHMELVFSKLGSLILAMSVGENW